MKSIGKMGVGRSEPYAYRSTCDRCKTLDYTARLVIPFGGQLTVCRSCRQVLTGIEDRRGLGPRTSATASIAESPQLERPVVAGLLMPGPELDEAARDLAADQAIYAAEYVQDGEP